MSTGYCDGNVVAVLLNLILPADAAIKFYDDKIGAAKMSNSPDEEVPMSEKVGDEDDDDRI